MLSTPPLKKAIIFDRDGTLIVDKIYLNDPEQVEFLPHTFEALNLLKEAGYVFCVATNQSGVPRGLVQLENLHLIHKKMQQILEAQGLEILSFHYAPYMTDSDHPMRKPNPGMLFEAQKKWGFELADSWMVGDRLSDVEAGHRAGCRSVWLTNEATLSGPRSGEDSTTREPEVIASTLLEACHKILAL